MVKPPNILIVDDQKGVRLLLELVFREEGYRVTTAANGSDAWRKVQAEPPDVVIMDVKMPVMGGLEALPLLKSTSPKTKVIMITAYADTTTLEEVWQKGASDFILKPFDLEDLKERVRRVLTDGQRPPESLPPSLSKK
ncbi:MAG: two-component system, response regulator, stage 0 sporulation protein [Clostridia bacterium]|nr:two-component system, response regulator, stage 0 sporulation protein [Clostridia bacterium]